MARPRRNEATALAVEAPATDTPVPPAGELPATQKAVEEDRPSAAFPPRPEMTVNLDDHKEGAKIHLVRSPQYKQMQIRSDEELSDRHRDMLKEAGWTDRTEAEGVYTKQLPKGEKWRAVADAEWLFKQIANEIREGKGLGPVMTLG